MTLHTLDIWISLVGIFAMLALLCTSLTEMVEGWRKHRAVLLHDTLALMLGDGSGGQPALLKTFYEHPAINPLYDGPYAPPGVRALTVPPTRLPSYIPARSFALAVLDMAAAGGPPSQLPGPTNGSLAGRARAFGAYLGPSMLSSQLRLLLDTVGDDDKRMLDGLVAWYDAAMDRLSGRYKRRTLGIGFLCGLAIAALLNVNPLAIANDLRQSDVRAAQVSEQVRAQVQAGQMTPAQANNALSRLDIPIGWGASALSDVGVSGMLLGWLVAGFAAMLGAPFWFDVLNKLTIVRATVKPHEKSPEEPALDGAPAASKRRTDTVADRRGDVGKETAQADTVALQSTAAAGQPTAGQRERRAGGVPAGEPPHALSRGLDSDAEECACGRAHANDPVTPDHELPLASGGVA